jgi:DNA polymerase-3 subunit epsilon
MLEQRFAVLDVETTNGDPTVGRVMEVAVLAMDGTSERVRWDSLVDPGTPIPPFIRRLTGIDDTMVKGEPAFLGVVNTLRTLTEDRILVAHNVRFDLTAITHEFARTGLAFQRPTLCTEQASRALLPNLSHYNLGSLCRHFGIPYHAAHRALPDAEATCALLLRLIDAFGAETLVERMVAWPQARRA